MSILRRAASVWLMGVALAGFARPTWTQEEGAPGLLTMSEERKEYREQDQGQVRELRLALVCYGGSSLAIYIHGNTKEVHRLVQASKALQQDALANEGRMQQAVAKGEAVEPGEKYRELTASSREWYDLLLRKWIDDPQKIRTRVVVDIVAGTSAGGINGVILAKALAHDLKVDDLTRLWLEKASLGKLTNHYFGLFRIFAGRAPVDGDKMVGWLYDALNSMDQESQEKETSGRTPSLLPRGDRLDLFVTATDRFGYPQNLVVGNPASAVEKRYRHVLHFVYPGVNRGCAPDTPRPPGEIDFFCPEWTPALTFAARTSSSIPGVFPPLHLEDTMATIAKAAKAGSPPGNTVVPAPAGEVVTRLFRNYQLQEANQKNTYATDTFFVDGGVLDNHPFGPAIAAILNRPQSQEVRRFLVYLQPDPGGPPAGPPAPKRQKNGRVKEPPLFPTIWAGLKGIPSGQPILDNLNDIQAQRTAVERIRDIVEAEEQAAHNVESGRAPAGDCSRLNELPVAHRFGCALGFDAGHLDEALQQATQSDLQQVRRRLERAAVTGRVEAADAGKDEERLDSAGRSYINLRVHSVLDQFVTVLSGSAACNYPQDSAHRALIGKIMTGWATGESLIGPQKEPAAQQEQMLQQRRFLEDFDVGYQRRQLRFVIDWIDTQYAKNPPPEKRQVLDELKRVAADRVETLTSLANGTSPELSQELTGIGTLFCGLRPWQLKDDQTIPLDQQKHAFLTDANNKAALSALRAGLGRALNRLQQQVRDDSFKEFKRLAPRLTPDERLEILVRYFGFPFWDRQIYPYVAFSGFGGELQEIEVYRLSPDDAALLGRRTASEKLKGAEKAHFGAFFSREGRESDYLWGRLDAGDRLLTILDAGTAGPTKLGTGDAKELFQAIVSEEKDAGLVRPAILAERTTEIERLP